MREIVRLRRKFVLYNMMIVTAVIAAAAAAGAVLFQRQAEERSQRVLAGVIAQQEDRTGPGQIFESSYLRIPHFSVLIDQDGAVTLLDGTYNSFPEEPYLNQVASRGLEFEEDQGELKDYHLRFMRVNHPSGYLMVFADTSYEDSMRGSLLGNVILICAGAWLCFLAMSVFFARWAVRPVEESIRMQKQFVADASHELKTPLTVITANAQLLNDQLRGVSSETDKWMHNMEQECLQMRGLIENLLLLARQDADCTQKTVWESISFSDLVTEEILVFEPVFFQCGKSIAYMVEDNIRVKGDPNQLRQLLKILLDNAVKYSNPEKESTVTLERISRHRVCLKVISSGETISLSEQRHIFQRFFRGETARSRQSGSGLGLSIADGIVRRHRGKIGLKTGENENCFYIILRMVH